MTEILSDAPVSVLERPEGNQGKEETFEEFIERLNKGEQRSRECRLWGLAVVRIARGLRGIINTDGVQQHISISVIPGSDFAIVTGRRPLPKAGDMEPRGNIYSNPAGNTAPPQTGSNWARFGRG